MPRRRTRRRSGTGHRRPPLGQHFLVDLHVRQQILERLDCQPTDCWLEIGAGHGEMTLLLAEKAGCVAAVEQDRILAEALKTRLSGFPGVHVVIADFLEISLPVLAQELNCACWRVCGNLPYYITAPILRQLFRAGATIQDIHVVVQREVAERLVAGPGGRDYGYLSVLTQFHAAPEILQSVPRSAFRPPPKVESALVRLATPGRQLGLADEEQSAFLRFLGSCFRQKRKTLFNNLRGVYPRERVESALAEAAFDLRVRAEQLSLEDFAHLYRIILRAGHSVVPPQTV